MELPFSPYFFKKIDAYNRLKSLENKNKTIWLAELLILKWAYGPNHQHTGAAVPKNIISDALYAEAKNEDMLLNESVQSIIATPELLTSELTRVGYVDTHWSGGGIVFNGEAYLAGKILTETNLLRRTTFYELWTIVWWFLLGLGVVLLLSQIILNSYQILRDKTQNVVVTIKDTSSAVIPVENKQKMSTASMNLVSATPSAKPSNIDLIEIKP